MENEIAKIGKQILRKTKEIPWIRIETKKSSRVVWSQEQKLEKRLFVSVKEEKARVATGQIISGTKIKRDNRT